MTVLIGWASTYGSTRGIAERIAARLSEHGMAATARSVDDLDGLEGADAAVLGSAIHNRTWLPEAAAFLERTGDQLATRPVWLFSVSSVGESSSFFALPVARVFRRLQNEPKIVTASRQRLGVRGHRSFAGAIDRSHWGLAGHLFLKTLGGRYGDHRDWDDIDTWADAIAADLGPDTTGRQRMM